MKQTDATIDVVFATLKLENYSKYVKEEGVALMSDLQDLEEEELAEVIAGAGMTIMEANRLCKALKAEARSTTEPRSNVNVNDLNLNDETTDTTALSKYLVCNDPKIWVIDDYISPDLLNYVDQNYKAQLTVKENELDCDFWTLDEPILRDEIIDALVTLAGIDEIQRLGQFAISDSRLPKDQSPHTDHVSLAWPQFKNDHILNDFLHMEHHDIMVLPPAGESSPDENKLIKTCTSMRRCHSRSVLNSSEDNRIKFVPTSTLLVYFCEEDGLVFPKATDWVPSNNWQITDKGTQVFGKRGRIIMFDNYEDDRETNPNANPKAEHFGLYTRGRTKRIFVGGVLSNKNLSHDKNVEKGMLYSVAYRKPPPAPNTWDHLKWGDELITVLSGARDSGSHLSLLRGFEDTVLRHICLFSAPEPEPEPEQQHHHGHTC